MPKCKFCEMTGAPVSATIGGHFHLECREIRIFLLRQFGQTPSLAELGEVHLAAIKIARPLIYASLTSPTLKDGILKRHLDVVARAEKFGRMEVSIETCDYTFDPEAIIPLGRHRKEPIRCDVPIEHTIL